MIYYFLIHVLVEIQGEVYFENITIIRLPGAPPPNQQNNVACATMSKVDPPTHRKTKQEASDKYMFFSGNQTNMLEPDKYVQLL